MSGWLKPKFNDKVSGTLQKQGHNFKSWKERLFELKMTSGELEYLDGSTKKGEYLIDSTSTCEDSNNVDSRTFCFELKALKNRKNTETLLMSAGSNEERTKWKMAIKEIITGQKVYIINDPTVWSELVELQIQLLVTYDEYNNVTDGNFLLPEAVTALPNISFIPAPTEFYSLVVVDADIPTDANGRQMFLHIMVNMTSVGLNKKSDQVLEYSPPLPMFNSGHHFRLLLLKL